ncbi:sensor histidine kinase [Radiobacillus deserti]|uniref:Signal transduction histidine-protein kinase/phosphatase DegS n=1 Tax=Radiobacillus deserti TaxID=2594883 RepID=A0A516KIS3_9BACI|nr:sensor histidine kinase [Radiobacillus deserti]QDP41289.1 histidine kinase [Radiobacillus deserti]
MARSDERKLDFIIDEMIDAVSNSKDEIFSIGEDSRKEFEKLRNLLSETKATVQRVIKEGDDLEQKVRFSRIRLSKVSQHFDQYNENQIREIYDQTHKLQTELTMKREKERNLREKRDDLERRLINLERTVARAESLVGRISVVLNYLSDDFKQVGDLLQEAHEKQEFGLRIIEAQEEERRRLSREMHDGPAQMLANILLRSELIDRTFRERSPEEALEEIKDMRKMVRSSLYEVRRIIYDLRPMALDDLGLIPTMKKYLANMSEYNKIDIEFTTHGKERRFNSKYEVALFRLVQESVQNAIKHAEASSIQVKVEITESAVLVVIKDDGKGFDTKHKKDHSFGLVGMKERVDMLEGQLKITSKVGKGTTIFIQVPLNE